MASRRAFRLVTKVERAVKQSSKTNIFETKSVSHICTLSGSNVAAKTPLDSAFSKCNIDSDLRHGFMARNATVSLNKNVFQQGLSKRSFTAAASLPPHEEIGMPSLSPTMTQGNVAKWRKKVGDAVAAGDVLCEIETDKATLEMESMEDGFLAKILLDEGAKDIPVGQTIAIMVENEDDIAKFADFSPGSSPPPPKEESSPSPPPPPPPPPAQEAPKSTPAPPPPPPSPSSEGRVFASPAARKLAEDNKVDISKIKGTGPESRIVKADVEEFLAKGPATPPSPTPSPSPSTKAAPPVEGVDYTDLPNSQIRKIIAQRLLQSKQTIPHYYLTVDVRVDKLSKLRQDLNAVQERAGGKKISVNDFVIKAAALALKKVPQVNASWTDDYIRQYHNVDISVAVQTDFGLMVPIVKDADKKGLATISEAVKTLAEKARENKLKPDEFQGGTFAISNLGMYGVKSFAAIINPPQACILAVGGTEIRVIPGKEAGEYEKATYMSVTLSCDHRVIDGALGAQWLGAFKTFVEDPVTLLL